MTALYHVAVINSEWDTDSRRALVWDGDIPLEPNINNAGDVDEVRIPVHLRVCVHATSQRF